MRILWRNQTSYLRSYNFSYFLKSLIFKGVCILAYRYWVDLHRHSRWKREWEDKFIHSHRRSNIRGVKGIDIHLLTKRYLQRNQDMGISFVDSNRMLRIVNSGFELEAVNSEKYCKVRISRILNRKFHDLMNVSKNK